MLDVNLNGQKSYSVADALTARSLPFAFVTGYGEDALMSDYRRFPRLQKPFKLLDMRNMLMRLLYKRSPELAEDSGRV